VGEDDKVTGEWPVSDYDYSRSAPPTGSPDSRDTKDAAEPTIKRAAGDDPDETEANPSRRRRPHSPDDQLTIRLEREDRPN
jgi:hypothetical protein